MINLRKLVANGSYQTAKFVAGNIVRNKYEARGKGAIPETEPFIIWADHDSAINIGEDAYLTGRSLRFVAKAEYFKIDTKKLGKPKHLVQLGFALLLRLADQIRFERDGSGMGEAYSGLERAIKDNAGIVLYPGGTRSRLDYIGRASPLMAGIAGRIIELSGEYGCRIHFISVGRSVKREKGRRTCVRVVCEEAAIADKGWLSLADAVAQREFDRAYSESLDKGLEFFVNSYIMPGIAALSGKEFCADRSSFLRSELGKRRSAAGNNRE